MAQEPQHQIQNTKLQLLNKVAACLLDEPKYYTPDASANRVAINNLVNQLADPEFILKLSLYVRDELNIRTTANYLLALAANKKECAPFLSKYFSAIIKLPSDMLEVISLYRSLTDRKLPERSLPTALRRVIAIKFTNFDSYQLAKYNNEAALKRKRRKLKKELTKHGKPIPKPVSAQVKPPEPTLKRMIRLIHISQPAEPVMAILGKKYPTTEEQFKKSGLTGTFDSTRIGKRMKLPIPETWETQLSAKKNKASTWEELIDHKKLPFMAMLRNLRNLIVTGISPKHHQIILDRLTDEKQVANSKQFPLRFLSAYDAINVNLEQLMNDVMDFEKTGDKVQVQVKGPKGKQLGMKRVIKKTPVIPVNMPDYPLIESYRKAIDSAIKFAVVHNVLPITGNTVVFCDVSGSMRTPCSSAKGLGSINSVHEIAILLGLMLKYVCDSCDLQIFSSPGTESNMKCHLSVKVADGSILENMKKVIEETTKLGGGTDFPFDYLDDLIERNQKIDQFIIISDMMIAPGRNEMNGAHSAKENTISGILGKYRKQVNPNLLFICVDLNGSGKSLVNLDEGEKHPNDILITGWSDQILRYIAERGTSQLDIVEKIDVTKGLGVKVDAGASTSNAPQMKKKL